MENADHPLLNWIPYKLVETDNEVYFEWIYLGDKKYVDPFFDETLMKCKVHYNNSTRYRVVSSVENLIEWSTELVSTELKSLLFHVSRCGSTMMTQSLAISPQNIVVSEAPIIDQIIRSDLFDLDKKRELIKSVIVLLGQKRFSEEKNLIVKLDSWHIFEVNQLRLIFPELPFVLLYRNPAEVLKSHAKLKGMHMVPNLLPASIFGISDQEIQEISFHQYGAVVLEKYFQAYLDFYATDKNVSIYNYKDGMKSVLERFLSFIDADYFVEEVDQMCERLNRHSKNENVVFKGDSFGNDALVIDLVKANTLYEKLDNSIAEYGAVNIS
ncbi:sulfotransferase family protein [Flavobacterium sp. LS1R47]|uniref:Sulfotransferase family protein n=1 Tax=Flavobacterium frigoritolerans TaxID=2987686 RepID=A0A9X3C7B8_9FLAO|nr:sulfotransferase family protein [Flavobacterium frigoritolerans]MCV9930972.1 sulfotransferase family protein [Flavobacterium frigoritolerans]